MINTLYSMNLLDTPLAFGAVLERAGFGSSRRLSAIFYFRDMTVLKVMFSAVLVAMLGLGYLSHAGMIDENSINLPDTVYGAQIVGGLIFGIGFVMGGWCPGTSAVGFAAGRLDALLFLIGSILGSILFNELFEHVRPLYTLGQSGTVHIFDTLGITKGAFALLFTAAGVAAFWFSELIEARIAAKRARFRGRSSAHPGMAPPFPREAVCTFFRRRLPTGFHRGNEAGADLDGTARPAFFRRRSLGHRHAAPAGIQHVAYSGLGIAQPGKPPRRQGRRSVNSASGRPVARQFGAMGIVPETHVVIVHGDKLHDETLVAIALERLGHTRYSILDGGWARWKAENRPADFYTRARSDEARAGHIPGARNRPFSSDLASGTVGVSLKPLTDLAEAYEKLVGDRHARLIVHCRTGHQASQTWFVLRRLLGYENVAWYDGGWTEWAARTEFPIETGVK